MSPGYSQGSWSVGGKSGREGKRDVTVEAEMGERGKMSSCFVGDRGRCDKEWNADAPLESAWSPHRDQGPANTLM